ncbi:MAG: M24 family metallopeptidase [Saccharospirillaceae bacterium]|nr:M24 family metallopeptidase [Pseudomonadales bacterium]NRB77433.1 M24 family metallopeptidase [Saccharospirillaceae bacterium]
MLSLLSNFLFPQKKSCSNIQLIKKYGPQNSEAARSIKNTELKKIIEETRIISPKVSEIHKQINHSLSNQTYSKLKLQSFIVDKLTDNNLLPSMVGYKGFPSAVAISVNKELIHNIPDNSIIKAGSIVTVEIAASSKIAYASQTWSYLVPPIDPRRYDLLKTAKLALKNAITLVASGVQLGDIGNTIQQTIESKGYNVVREYCGFAMGTERIMEPQILGYGKIGTGEVIKSGQILNIQVMAIDGKRDIKLHKNGWGVTAIDANNSVVLSAMVLVTDTGYERLSQEHIN